MYYNASDFDYNVEDLINDYLVYGKNNRKAEYKIGKGWPDYKDVKIDVSIQEVDSEDKNITEMNNSNNIAPKMPEPMPLYPAKENKKSISKIFNPSCPSCGPGPILPLPQPRPPISPQPMPAPPECVCPQPMPTPPIQPRPLMSPQPLQQPISKHVSPMPYEQTPMMPDTSSGNLTLKPDTPTGNVQPSQPIPEALLPGVYQSNMPMPPTDEYSTIDDKDAQLMQLLYSEVNRRIYPHVDRILDEFEYVGSPVYSEQIDRETIAQIVDRVISSSRNDIDEIEEILLQDNDDVRQYWASGRMLRTVIEALVLSDIFSIRRPRYRRIRRNYNYLNNYYNGLNYYY